MPLYNLLTFLRALMKYFTFIPGGPKVSYIKYLKKLKEMTLVFDASFTICPRQNYKLILTI